MRKSTGLTHHCLWTPPRYGSSRRLVRYCSAATASRIGLNRELSTVLRSLDAPLAVHDPEVLLNLAISVGIGGDCLADIVQLRAEPAVFNQWHPIRLVGSGLVSVSQSL